MDRLRTYYVENAETELAKRVGEAYQAYYSLLVRSEALRIALTALGALFEVRASVAELEAGERFVVACFEAWERPPSGWIPK